MSLIKNVLFSGSVAATTLLVVLPSSAATLTQAQPPLRPVASGATLLVDQLIFSGNKTFSDSALQQIVAPDLGQPMALGQIKALAERVEAHYHQSGYRLAKVVVPAQPFAPGKPVQILITEGWLDRIEVTGNQRYDQKRVIQAMQAHELKTGEAFRFESVERALTRLNRQSGIATEAVLRPGAEQGATTLEVKVTEARRVQGAVEINNYGSKSTGEVRMIPSVTLPNVSGRGDALSALVLKSLSGEGTFFGRVGYELPIGYKGYRFSSFYSQGNTSVGGDFSALQVKGDNESIGIGVLHERVLSAQDADVLEAWVESHDLKQEILGVTNNDDRVRKLRVGYTRERSSPTHRNVLSIQGHQGLGTFLGGMPNNSPLSSRAISGADNRFTKLTAEWSRLQRLSQRMLMIPRVSAQISADPLVVGEQISVGGFYSVAGHAPSARSGDSGLVVNLEGRYAARASDDRLQYLARLDHGLVVVNDTFIGQRRQESLTGAAFGLVFNPFPKLLLRIEYALPLSKQTEDSHYIYAQARYQF